jgi:uncharacterized membrane protein YphA (DoxX/SURF4 family)
VGWVFVSEGVQKFLFPAQLGVGRFEKIGIPSPHLMAPFVGTVEIVCGSLLLIGLFTRLAAIPLLAVILVAIATTKIPDARQNRRLEHAARGPHRLQHVAGIAVFADHRRRIARAGRAQAGRPMSGNNGKFPGRAASRCGITILILLAFAAPSTALDDEKAWHSYTNSDYGFSLKYPDNLTLFSTGLDAQNDHSSYIPICTHATRVCLLYNGKEYEGTNFEAAAFTVNVRREARTKPACDQLDAGSDPVKKTRNQRNIVYLQSTGRRGPVARHQLKGLSHLSPRRLLRGSP